VIGTADRPIELLLVTEVEIGTESTLKGLRDRAILTTLLYHGIRREELCHLRRAKPNDAARRKRPAITLENIMVRLPRLFTLLLFLGPALAGSSPVAAQVRITPKEAKGGEKQGEAWAEVPESFRNLMIPDWPADEDGGAPTDGVVVLEKKLRAVYRLFGKGENFRSVLYKKTGHEYLPEMKAEMVEWFERHLPVKK